MSRPFGRPVTLSLVLQTSNARADPGHTRSAPTPSLALENSRVRYRRRWVGPVGGSPIRGERYPSGGL